MRDGSTLCQVGELGTQSFSQAFGGTWKIANWRVKSARSHAINDHARALREFRGEGEAQTMD